MKKLLALLSFAVILSMLIGPAQAAEPAQEKPFAGVELNVITQTGPFISGPIRLHAPEFEELTGIKVNAIEVPNPDIFPKVQQAAATGSKEFDLLLVSNTWVADLVNMGYVIPLDPYIERDKDDPLLAWDDVPQGIKLKDQWGGHTYAFIIDNDNQTMFYRKDILGDPKWQEAYKAETGKDLPNPPQTLDELIEVAKLFHGKDWDDDGVPENGFITSVTRGAQTFWYAYPWVAPYSVMPKEVAPAQGIFMFTPDMAPLVNTPGFVKGVEKFVEIIDCCIRPGRDSIRADVIEEIIRGDALIALDWGDIGSASVADRSVVKDKVGFALSPGTMEYWNWQTGEWVKTEEVHRAPTHAFNGWSYYITSTTENPDAAWEWIKFAASPKISSFDVASPDSGYQPWRISHSENLDLWVDANWTREEAKLYVQAILDCTNHPNAVFDPRIPGAARFQDTFEYHLLRAVAGEVSVQEAMDDCAAEFNDIIEEIGKDNLIEAFKAHLAIYEEAE